MLHLPALRWGQPYKSLETDRVVHFLTGEPVAEVTDVDADGVPCRFYRPSGADAGLLVHLHGGGFVFHDVEVHEFLGSLVYRSSGRPKTVRFWRMQASGRPVAKLMRDVRAVRWLSLAQAIARLTHEREKLFLEKVGRHLARST